MLTAGELVGKLIAAVPVPFDRTNRIDRDAQQNYAAHLAGRPVDGVAVWAHTGRGLRLSPEDRAVVLRDWRAALPANRPVVAAAGASPESRDWPEALGSARRMAEHAAELGADALLVHPPVMARGRPDQDALVEDYHAEVARAGLPLILFYLYEAAGGVSYSAGVLGRLLGRPEVVGIKVATLDSVMTFQDVARLVCSRTPEKVLITGEDRFLGYSLMCGARAALIGMGAACCELQASMLRSYWSGDAERFLELSRLVDRLAVATFKAPMEGYIQRMLFCLLHEGIIPADVARDPWGPGIGQDEGDSLRQVVEELREAVR